ncbi:hypothetical protein FA15DRAFT_759586 [Coprinopsis marcescibilis]|uniref:F-box domain-containing protein n=1 Tax=Coprinopsis marcescibilis TaxID=230819 RepID=A0A5C3KJK8_COPMA|nr:hypothetical protein FA15DRAFT_759586 [Coprinopsis marcescibilis]
MHVPLDKSTGPTLPPELLQEIMEHIAIEAFPGHGVHMENLEVTPCPCKTALRAASQCALASHFLRDHFLPLIFHRIRVSTVIDLKNLLSLLHSNPVLVSHIKCLQLQEECGEPDGDDVDWLLSANEPEHLFSLFKFLSSASVLRELSFIAAGVRRKEVFPPVPLRGSIRNLMSQPQLRALEISRLAFTMEAVEWLKPTLQCFRAGIGIQVRGSSDSSWASSLIYTGSNALAVLSFRRRSYQLHFREVEVDFVLPIRLRWFPRRSTTLTPLPNLIKLTFKESIMAIIPQGLENHAILAPKLRSVTLSLDHRACESLERSMLKFSHLCISGPFENVEIIRRIYEPNVYDPETVAGDISVFLSDPEMTQQCKLQTLKITFLHEDQLPPRIKHILLLSHIEKNFEWAKLDKVLARPFFVRLRKIVLNIRKFNINQAQALDLQSRIQGWMPTVQEIHGAQIHVEF